jgi:MFS family permease
VEGRVVCLFCAAKISTAIWQNSIKTGDRSKWTNIRFVLLTIGGMGGPVLSMALIASTGTNKWELEDLVLPWSFGCCALAIASGLRFHLSNEDTLGTESSSSLEAHMENDKENLKVRKCCCFGYESIAYFKVLMDIWYGIASGMTIKFFPLWLTELGLSQLELNSVIALQFLMISILAVALKVIANRFGRMQVAFVSRICGLVFLLTIILGEPYFWDLKWLCAFLQIFRTGLMNASSGITNSVLNDFLPKEKRARWNALDQVVSFGWSASALLGGFILTELSFRLLFGITFVI